MKEEFVYDEGLYIKNKDLEEYEDLMMSCDYMPEDIESEDDFNSTLEYLISLTLKSPDFLPPYEFALSMLRLLKENKEVIDLQADVETRLIKACERIAEKENIFDKTVEWAWLENRPLIRGLFHKANQLWEAGKIKEANELFSKIYKTNKDDNIGARYSVKATKEGISFEEFNERFTLENEHGTFFNTETLFEWYGEE